MRRKEYEKQLRYLQVELRAGMPDDDEMTALSLTIEEYDFPTTLITLNGVCRRLSWELA